MSRSTRNPTNWDDYQYGPAHRSSVSSAGGRSVRFSETVHSSRDSSTSRDQPPYDEERNGDGGTLNLRRRRSSVALRLNAIVDAGGVNSIANFARSWQRAAGFHEVAPHRPSFLLASEDDGQEDGNAQQYQRKNIDSTPNEQTSLLRRHLEGSPADERAVEDTEDEDETPGDERASFAYGSDTTTPRPLRPEEQDKYRLGSTDYASTRGSQSILTAVPHLMAELTGSYGTSYGTLRSTRREASMVHAAQIWRTEQDVTAPEDGDRAPLIVKEVEQDGKIVLAVAGQSTLPQTIFNATNVLIGVGILSLPLGIKFAGLVCGMTFLLLAAIITAYTAKLLAKCLDVDASLITFADLAFITYGHKARIVTGILFMLELLAANVALVILFADTLDLLIPGVGVTEWKVVCGILMIPLNFVPLRLLSFTSVLGIFSCFCIVLIVLLDGLIKPNAPGSLREPAPTYLFPENWLTLPLSFGILISPFGGHSVFPSIYRDMRHPYKYARAVKTSFTFTYLLDAVTALCGILMFGDGVRDEITSNIIRLPDYPRTLTLMMSTFIAIIPITKLPLNARPIISTIEVLTGLDERAVSNNPSMIGLSSQTRGLLRVTIRALVIVLLVILAVIFPAFDRIMAFMGSALCFSICIILPLVFYLKLFGDKIGKFEKLVDYIMIVVFSILALTGTVFAFLPKELIGAE